LSGRVEQSESPGKLRAAWPTPQGGIA